ncbi:restriction endonuclease subunit S [Aeromonas media]|uniref:restriction endonuclease subunit S n=1 Tax=Aeromonas media TaxID=651 RepID=UPI001CF24591|nr:restriction endonuclease subunit S [Aeromonas media]UCP13797.1 restriction endonuclease subunit S [Aeromonas media]
MTIENLITDHLDLWTAAVRPKSSAGRGSNSKLVLTGIKKLRELILELAVRGKLVPQDPSDEPASALLERIAIEKARLVKEGKIKMPKALPEISEEEKPFELPEGWEWVKLEGIGHDHGQKVPDSSFTYIDVGAINKDIGVIDSATIVAACDAPSRARKIVKLGTVIYSTIRPYLLNIAVIDEKFSPEPIASTAFAIIHPFDGVLSRYVYRYLRSPCFVSYVESVQTGIAYPAINDKQFFNGVIPLPPTEEQHRIVAKVDELMALCDQLEQRSESQLAAHQTLVETLLATLNDSSDADELAQNWARLNTHFDTLFTTEASIDALKQTVLQLAVMGKLVPQDPSDEPASVLLERIATEKTQLVKEKKIKKEKPLPAISEDEKPFELPLGWVWSRICESSLFCEYGSSEKTVSELSDGIPVLKMGDIQEGKVVLGCHQVVSSKIDDLPNLYLKQGDVLYNRTNSAELVGKTGMFNGNDDTYTFASYLIRIRCSINNVRPEYLTLCMNSPLFRKTQIEPHIKQQCGQANVNGTLMKSMLVSIPPYNEQVLILQKVNELMTLCDQLKFRLQINQQTQLALAETLVEGALA